MFKPVKQSFYDHQEIVGFAHFQKDAEQMLGARVRQYEVALPYRTQDCTQAWNAARRLQLYFTNWIKEKTGDSDPRGPHPRVVALSTAKGGGYTLMLDFFFLARDIPVGRNIKEALENPVAFHPRTKKRKLYYKGRTPVHKKSVLLPKSYVKKTKLETTYRALILSDAARVEKGEDERYHARLTYWHLDPVQLPRDVPPEPKQNENFDLWGGWKVAQTTATAGGLIIEQVDEGSGKPMGSHKVTPKTTDTPKAT